MGRINQEILEDVKAMRATDNAKLAAETPPKAPDTSIIVYQCQLWIKLTVGFGGAGVDDNQPTCQVPLVAFQLQVLHCRWHMLLQQFLMFLNWFVPFLLRAALIHW